VGPEDGREDQDSVGPNARGDYLVGIPGFMVDAAVNARPSSFWPCAVGRRASRRFDLDSCTMQQR
jgi:hypothetical protein